MQAGTLMSSARADPCAQSCENDVNKATPSADMCAAVRPVAGRFRRRQSCAQPLSAGRQKLQDWTL